MPLDLGAMDRRIVIQVSTPTTDAFNEPVPGWSTLATVWASKEDIRDGERWRAASMSADVTTRFRIHYSSVVAGVDPTHRILFGGRIYDIVAVKEIGRREGLEVTAAARSEVVE